MTGTENKLRQIQARRRANRLWIEHLEAKGEARQAKAVAAGQAYLDRVRPEPIELIHQHGSRLVSVEGRREYPYGPALDSVTAVAKSWWNRKNWFLTLTTYIVENFSRRTAPWRNQHDFRGGQRGGGKTQLNYQRKAGM